jgi:hypothetical protein
MLVFTSTTMKRFNQIFLKYAFPRGAWERVRVSKYIQQRNKRGVVCIRVILDVIAVQPR